MIYLLHMPPSAQIIITNANNNACNFFNSPDAIGLFRFVGCFLSFSMSIISLMMYSLPESMQKMAKAAITLSHIWTFRRFIENTMPTNRIRFLYHCFGRIVTIISFIISGKTPSLYYFPPSFIFNLMYLIGVHPGKILNSHAS